MAPDFLLANIALIVVALVFLWKGADWLVESASRIAATLGVPELVIGLTIVAFGTSAPEFAVTVGAALEGLSDISLANVVGSNIFNLGFVLGTCAVLSPVAIERKVVTRDTPLLLGVGLLLVLMCRNGRLDRWEGVVFLVIFVSYLTFLYVKKEPVEEVSTEEKATVKDIPLLLVGLAMVAGGGKLLVDNAVVIAESFGISQWIIGVTIVAAGTSLPELVTSVTATLKGKHGISAGNLVGSDLFNFLGVLGLAAVIQPLEVQSGAYRGMFLFIGMTIIVIMLMGFRKQLGRREGYLLWLMAAFRWGVDMLL